MGLPRIRRLRDDERLTSEQLEKLVVFLDCLRCYRRPNTRGQERRVASQFVVLTEGLDVPRYVNGDEESKEFCRLLEATLWAFKDPTLWTKVAGRHSPDEEESTMPVAVRSYKGRLSIRLLLILGIGVLVTLGTCTVWRAKFGADEVRDAEVANLETTIVVQEPAKSEPISVAQVQPTQLTPETAPPPRLPGQKTTKELADRKVELVTAGNGKFALSPSEACELAGDLKAEPAKSYAHFMTYNYARHGVGASSVTDDHVIDWLTLRELVLRKEWPVFSGDDSFAQSLNGRLITMGRKPPFGEAAIATAASNRTAINDTQWKSAQSVFSEALKRVQP